MRDKQIDIAYPASENLHLWIALGACRLEAKPSDGNAWVSVTYHDPTMVRAPVIDTKARPVKITEAEPSFETIPDYFKGVPRYQLQLGKNRPFALTIRTGASEFDLDLGGVPLKALTVEQRAGRFNLDFSAPNPEPMSRLEILSGAAGLELENLANANFSEMRLSGGAAAYELNFGGTLSQDAEAKIETGLSSVDIQIPHSTAAKVIAETTVGSVDVGEGFTRSEGAYWTKAEMARTEPLLTVHAGMRLGTLQLRVS